ncbi:Lysine histidine transporter 1 [Bienertia sinuspersici]
MKLATTSTRTTTVHYQWLKMKRWWYSAIHNVTGMVGAGILGLPFAMSQLGWYVLQLPLSPLSKYCNIKSLAAKT